MPEPIRKTALSRWAERMLAARPELAAERDAPGAFSREEMVRALVFASATVRASSAYAQTR